MRITDAFLGEHAVFYAQFDWVDTLIEQDPSLPEIKTASALIAAALVSHAQLENELLFAPLEHERGPVGPTLVMRMEHDEIEQLLHQVGRASEPAGAARLLWEATHQARVHFAKEEQVAFPLAEHLLGAARLRELGALWAKHRAIGTEGGAADRVGVLSLS